MLTDLEERKCFIRVNVTQMELQSQKFVILMKKCLVADFKGVFKASRTKLNITWIIGRGRAVGDGKKTGLLRQMNTDPHR